MTDPLYILATDIDLYTDLLGSLDRYSVHCLFKKNQRLIKFIKEEGFTKEMNKEEKQEFYKEVINCPLFKEY